MHEMLYVREYGHAGPPVMVLHGGPAVAGHMAPIARRLASSYRVFEPFQRRSGLKRLTVATHVADLHDVINVHAEGCRPALIGASWGAMLALAYAAAHPDAAGPLILVGCGTFDPRARAALERTIAERTTDAIRAQLRTVVELDYDNAFKVAVEATTPIYSVDLFNAPHDDDLIDEEAHYETWEDMLRLQANGTYPAAFAAIKVPVLMVHGTFDPHPGRLILESLRPHLPQLEYRELERCGHYPWLEKAAADRFFLIVGEWLGQHMERAGA
jgi:pimeloyl-ACP methyl ester carboxylesterase